MNKTVAVIDLGTNTFHLLIAAWDGSRFHITRRDREASKIGVGGINQGMITEAAIHRAVKALKRFKAIIDEEAVTTVQTFGTSAFRNAKNGATVAQQILDETGIRINIISGEQEAEYIYQGVCLAVPPGNETSLVVDIGGGSVEFILGKRGTILWKRSLEIGGQRLLERFHRHDPILPEEVDELDAYLDDVLQPVLNELQNHKPTVLVGSSGTFDTLSDIHCIRNGLPLDPNAPETPLTLASFYETFGLLLKKNREERLQIPGMIDLRVDMIVVACCLIRFLIEKHPFKAVRVSRYSLKEGVLSTIRNS